jgi:hypothetical protein
VGCPDRSLYVRYVAQSKGDGDRIEGRIGELMGTGIASHPRNPARDAFPPGLLSREMQHPFGDVQADHGRAVDAGLKARDDLVSSAGRKIQEADVLDAHQPGGHFLPPRYILPQGDDPVYEIVGMGDTVEHRSDVHIGDQTSPSGARPAPVTAWLSAKL